MMMKMSKLHIEIELDGDIDQRKFELFHIYMKKTFNPKEIKTWRT
jgi:hypothetical protein